MKAFIPSLTFLVAALCATSLLPNTAEAQSAVSNVHGVQKVTLTGGGNSNLISTPFVHAPVLTSRVATVSGTQITLEATLPTSVTLAGAYYVDVQSGSGNGRMTDIVSVASQTITCADDLSAVVAVGDSVSLRKIPTIDDAFGADNKFGFKSSADGDPTGCDLVYVMDPESKILGGYFYVAIEGYEGWYDAVTLNPSGSIKMYPENGVLTKIEGPNVIITNLGEVKNTVTNVAVFPGANFIAIKNPLSSVTAAPSRLLTLGNSSLYTGNTATGVTGSPTGDPSEGDLVYVLDPVTNVFKSYFYVTLEGSEGWYDTVTFDSAANVVLESGSAFYIDRIGATGFNWTHPVNF